MNLLITGASGFVGSHLLGRILEEKTINVAILIRNPESSWRLNSIDGMQNAHTIVGSLDDPRTYKEGLRDFQPDVVVHLAWNGVEGRDRNSEQQWKNVLDMLELLNMCYQFGARKFVGFGSQGEYGNLNSRIKESDVERPTTLYGMSKLSACNLGQIAANDLGMEFVWIRLFDPYGPKDGGNWFLSYVIKEFLQGGSPKVTKSEQYWDYIYIDDAVEAIVRLIKKDGVSGVFNLGSGSPVQLKSVIEKIREITGSKASVNFGSVPYRDDQIMHLEADIEKISAEINWRPLVDLDAGLRKSVVWWKARLCVKEK